MLLRGSVLLGPPGTDVRERYKSSVPRSSDAVQTHCTRRAGTSQSLSKSRASSYSGSSTLTWYAATTRPRTICGT
eukprot:443046-Rhodomonas_salina.1